MVKYFLILIIFFSREVALCQDTLSFKINSGGTSSKNSISLAYSVGDLLVTPSNAALSVFPITSLPEFIVTGLLNSTLDNTRVSVFPNPVGEVLSVQSSTERGKLLLFDALGKKIREENWPVELPLQDCQPGEYYLVLISIKQKTASYKIIKQ